jgi:hypothetical protein
VRPGLLAVGTAFLAVAVALTAAFYALPVPQKEHETATEVPPVDTNPNGTLSVLLSGTNSSTGSFNLTWGASRPVDVELYDVPGCTSPGAGCPRSDPVASWTSQSSGAYTWTGPVAFPYLLVWTDKQRETIALWASAVAQQTQPGSFPILMDLLVDAAVLALATTGALAIFLGSFLKAGYRPPRGPMGPGRAPRTIEGDGVTDPRTDSPSDAAGSLRPGPTAPMG